jgi:hypothetical protein
MKRQLLCGGNSGFPVLAAILAALVSTRTKYYSVTQSEYFHTIALGVGNWYTNG